MEKHLGIELEVTGVTRLEIVTALENLFETKAERKVNNKVDSPYEYYLITDKDGKVWRVIRDRSIRPQLCTNRLNIENSEFGVVDLDDSALDFMSEVVSPVLDSNTLPTLFAVVKVLKAIGCVTNETCGIHVHIDSMDLEDTVSLFRRFLNEQDSIFSAFNVADNRKDKYCKLYDSNLRLSSFDSIDDFMKYLWIFYRDLDVDAEKEVKDSKSLRYYGLNFYSLYTHKTIEYRIFNGTLDSIEIAKILKWVLDFSYPYCSYAEYVSVLEDILVKEIKG